MRFFSSIWSFSIILLSSKIWFIVDALKYSNEYNSLISINSNGNLLSGLIEQDLNFVLQFRTFLLDVNLQFVRLSSFHGLPIKVIVRNFYKEINLNHSTTISKYPSTLTHRYNLILMLHVTIRIPAIYANTFLTVQANQQQLLTSMHFAAIPVLFRQQTCHRLMQLINQIEPDQPILFNVGPAVRAAAFLKKPPVDAFPTKGLRTFHTNVTLAKAVEANAALQQDGESGVLLQQFILISVGHGQS